MKFFPNGGLCGHCKRDSESLMPRRGTELLDVHTLKKKCMLNQMNLINTREKAPNSPEQGIGSHESRSSQDPLKVQGRNGEKGVFLGES